MSKTSVWQRTRTPNLLRHKGGRYYGRFTIAGKGKFLALRTDVFEVAKIRLAEERVKIERTRNAVASVADGTCKMGDLIEVYRSRVLARTDLGERTRTRLVELTGYFAKTWPGFAELRPAQVTKSAVEGWRNRALVSGTGFRPPGSKTASKATSGASPGTFNKVVDVLRHLLNIAVERGALGSNPLLGRGIKAKYSPKKAQLPEAKTLHAICSEIEKGQRGGWGIETADFCRFLMFTGCRKSEAAAVRWSDIDAAGGMLSVSGTKTDASRRRVPLVPAAKELIEKIRERRLRAASVAVDGAPTIDPSGRVLSVSEAAKSLTRACATVGVPRLTHHDLRDAFATQAIEAGVDIPTVAAWLGHADGGALLMRVYAHHRRAHSVSQAAKVNF